MSKPYLKHVAILALMFTLFLSFGCTRCQELRMREATLKEDLYLLRDAISQYTQDKSKPPTDMDALVAVGYFHRIPIDPITGSANWRVVKTQGGISDIHSASHQISSEGTPYDSW